MTPEPAPGSSDPLDPGNAAPPPRLLDQLQDLARAHGHSEPAVASFASWARRFILFHGKRHPHELGLPEIGGFLNHVVRSEPQPLPALHAARWTCWTSCDRRRWTRRPAAACWRRCADGAMG